MSKNHAAMKEAAQSNSLKQANAVAAQRVTEPAAESALCSDTIQQSPRQLAQRHLNQRVNESPRMVAQRRQIDGVFGTALSESAAPALQMQQAGTQSSESGRIGGLQSAANPAAVIQPKVIAEGGFKNIKPLQDALGHIQTVVSQDRLLGELYQHALEDRSNLTFTTGSLRKDGAVGLTELYIGGVKISSKTDFNALVGADPAQVLRSKMDTLITIDYDAVLRAMTAKDNEQPSDLLQILAHEYGVHATKNLVFLNELRQFEGKPKAMIAHFTNAYQGKGSMSGGTHHKTHMEGRDVFYNRFTKAFGAILSPDEFEKFRLSEFRDQEMQKKTLAMLEPAIESIGQLQDQLRALEWDSAPPFKSKPKASTSKATTSTTPLLVDDNADDDADDSSSCCCFITTACTKSRGLPDDCEELTVLRGFRDNFLCSFEEGEALCELYYRISPGIVDSIAHGGNATQIYEWLYRLIRYCVDAILRGDYLAAFYTYVGMVILLLQWFPS
jgi:hypothetical protein